jgi:hypothetical protein
MQTTRPVDVGATIAALCRGDVAGPVSTAAVGYLDALFGRRGRPGIEMAARTLRLAMPEDRVEVVSIAYAAAVLTAVREQT